MSRVVRKVALEGNHLCFQRSVAVERHNEEDEELLVDSLKHFE